MALPLEASASAPGILRVAAAPGAFGVDEEDAAAPALPNSNQLASIPCCSRKPLTFTNCDLMVSLNTLACWAMVEPPRNTTPDNKPASTRQTMVSRRACGSLTTRPSKLVIALRATPSRMPAKIRNSVVAKTHANNSSAANPIAPMPPTEIAHARSLRAERRSSTGTGTSFPCSRSIPARTVSSNRRRIKPGRGPAHKTCRVILVPQRFDAGAVAVASVRRGSRHGQGRTV